MREESMNLFKELTTPHIHNLHIPKGMCGVCGTVGRVGSYASPQPHQHHKQPTVATVGRGLSIPLKALPQDRAFGTFFTLSHYEFPK